MSLAVGVEIIHDRLVKTKQDAGLNCDLQGCKEMMRRMILKNLGEGVSVRDHLNALGSGTGGTGSIIVSTDRIAEVGVILAGNISNELSGTLDQPQLTASIDQELSGSINFNLTGDLCQQ